MSMDPMAWNDGEGDCPGCGEYAILHAHPAIPNRVFVSCVEGGCGEFEVDDAGERVEGPPDGFTVYATPIAVGRSLDDPWEDPDEPF